MHLHLWIYHVLFIGLLCVPPSLVLAADFSGPAVSVLDGDTIEVLHNNRAERIRLNGIDCPEIGQPHGKRAKQATSELVFGKESRLRPTASTSTGAALPM